MANCGQQLDFRLQIRTLKLVTTATGYVTRIIDSFDVGHNDLEYRAEGNANIVLAIPQRCQVLRLPKLTKRYWVFLIYNYVRPSGIQAKENNKEYDNGQQMKKKKKKKKTLSNLSAGMSYL